MKVGPHVMTHGKKNQHDREVVPRVGTSASQATHKPANLKLIQCQLLLLVHARRCQARQEFILEKTNGENPTDSVTKSLLLNCPVRHCQEMKRTLEHLKTCSVGASCTFQHCSSSLRILGHWTNCTLEECPLCQCVRQRMRRAKEWERTIPRNSRYTLLAAALRSSSQSPHPVPPNCNAAELAQEAQSGFPSQSQELRSWPNASCSNQIPPQNGQKQGTSAEGGNPVEDGKSTIPTLEQVRKAYEQLGIPCTEEALRRLMATLPNASQDPASRRQRQMEKESSNESDESSDSNMDVSNNADQGVFGCYPTGPSTSQKSDSRPQQQPTISSTTSVLKLPCKSSTHTYPLPK